jgi:exonuclease III
MKVLSFNCRGLASPHKKYSLKRLLTTQQPDVLLLQETMVDSTTTSTTLVTLLPGWHFEGIDAFGRSGGLITGWHSRSIKLLNSWALNSCLGVDFLWKAWEGNSGF